MNRIVSTFVATLVAMFAFVGTTFGQVVMEHPRFAEKWNVLVSAEANTTTLQAAEESKLYTSLDLQGQLAKNKAVQPSLFGKVLYNEYKVSEKNSVGLTIYHDQEYWEVIPTILRSLTDELQVGMGTGVARYDDQNWLTVTLTAYFEKDGYKWYLHAQRFPKDKENPWYFKTYGEKAISERFILGFRGESFFGLGPMLGFAVTPKWKIYFVKPLVLQPKERDERYHGMILTRYEF